MHRRLPHLRSGPPEGNSASHDPQTDRWLPSVQLEPSVWGRYLCGTAHNSNTETDQRNNVKQEIKMEFNYDLCFWDRVVLCCVRPDRQTPTVASSRINSHKKKILKQQQWAFDSHWKLFPVTTNRNESLAFSFLNNANHVNDWSDSCAKVQLVEIKRVHFLDTESQFLRTAPVLFVFVFGTIVT